MPKRLPEFAGCFPSENQAEAALCMEHEWPELDRVVTLSHLSIKYCFDYNTLHIAANALCRRGILVKRERKTGNNWWTRRTVDFYRRATVL